MAIFKTLIFPIHEHGKFFYFRRYVCLPDIRTHY